MATKIVTKNSSTAGSAPSASDLVQGELAVNVTDGRLYTENASGAIVELGLSPSGSVDINGGTIDGTTVGATTASTGAFTTLSASGEIAANGGIALGDNDKATFGASDDLEIYHDGSNSYISDVGTGSLRIKSNGSFIDIQSDTTRINNAANSEIMATFVANGAVTLNYDNGAKIATTATGIDVTGTVVADTATFGSGSGSALIGNFVLDGASHHYLQFANTNTTEGGILFGDPQDANVGALTYNHSTNAVAFTTAAAERMRIDSSGNVGIGVTPDSHLHVNDAGVAGLRVGYNNTGVNFYDADTHNFRNSATNLRVVIDSSGRILAGSGITLGNSTTYSAANTLNDYEEGTFTPTIVGSTTAGTGTYTIQSGKYVIVGKIIYVSIRLGWSAHTGAGGMKLAGLPNTSNSDYANLGVVYRDGLTVSSGKTVNVSVVPNTNYANILEISTGTDLASLLALDTAVTDLSISGCYQIA